MRPSKNAFIGYSYQEQITFLFLAHMDAERIIDRLEIEADVKNNFDDVKISIENNLIYSQIKDFDEVELTDLKFSENQVLIKGKKHSLANNCLNVLFFKKIDINSNCNLLGIPALKTNNVHIISLSRIEANEAIDNLYKNNEIRKITINKFFSDCLDNRILAIKREDLPIINTFETKLLEETIDVGKRHLEFSNILHIEGKPGVGKSHYVNKLSTIHNNSFVYRLWISNQDKDYKKRLVYSNFISDITKKLFGDYVNRNETEVIDKLRENGHVFIIDGLDHVENYNREDLEKFVDFINQLIPNCKTIVLSRPLKLKTIWKKQILNNWNENETKKVLDELYHINKYSIYNSIYSITDGYPILVKFFGEHYKAFKEIPNLEKLKDVEDYYNQILESVNTKTALTLFLSSQSFFMESELKLFLKDELHDYLQEFITAYPYLFEKRLNRISLFHDSLNKYLREQGINYIKRKDTVGEIVSSSILKREKRFMSRFAHFELKTEMKLKIIKQFSSIEVFKDIMKDCIDFEAVRAFYNQLREALVEISCDDLEITNYYDLSLIINIVNRDHISTLNQFLYTYTKCLFFNGYSTEDVTSSEYLFGMLTYVIEQDAIPLHDITSDSFYSTTRFLEGLENDVLNEEQFFLNYKDLLKLSKPLDTYLKDDFHWREYLTQILTNLYIHKTEDESLLELQNCVNIFIDDNEDDGIRELKNILDRQNSERRYPHWVLNDVKKKLLALGKLPENNPYLNLSLKDYIKQKSSIGSFDMWTNILSYIRLSVEQGRRIDIESISLFWCMYYRRKDYSVINIDVALKVFEKNELIDEETGIKTIVLTQEMSEKGIRHLLADYISIHPPSIIEKVIELYDLDELNISWFDLPPNHISEFPEKVFNYAVNTLWKQNRINHEVDFKDIANVFYSSKWSDLLKHLKFFKFKIRISDNALELEKLEKSGITVMKQKEEHEKINPSDYRYKEGILDSRDEKFIIEKGLSSTEVSGYLNGNYAALKDLKIYQIYPKEEITKNLKEIIYNAVLGKIRSINSYGSMFYLVGNLPKLIDDYGNEKDVYDFHKSFEGFLELSLLKTW